MKNILQRNNVKITGEGHETLLFAHGFGCDQNSWRHITSAFSLHYKLILFDFIGAGQSDFSGYNKTRYNNLEGYSEDIFEICNQLKIKDAIFIGHSVSCMIGALAAIKYPSVFKKLIFIGPSPHYLNDNGYVGGFEKEDIETLLELMEDNYISWAKSMAPAIMGNPQQPALGKELTDNFCSTDPEIAKAFARVTFLSDNRKDLPKIPVESLTLQCSDDILAPLEVGYYIKQNTPDNKLVILKATGHCPHMSAPEETINAIRSFI
ncbi:MAG: alpha/beta hydrolase [Chitinophagaceae bacterium]|nr:alpha/beta hydrolase [Chitinophagaceae bacterium]